MKSPKERSLFFGCFLYVCEGCGKGRIVLEQDSKKITFLGFICIVLFTLFWCQRIKVLQVLSLEKINPSAWVHFWITCITLNLQQ